MRWRIFARSKNAAGCDSLRAVIERLTVRLDGRSGLAGRSSARTASDSRAWADETVPHRSGRRSGALSGVSRPELDTTGIVSVGARAALLVTPDGR